MKINFQILVVLIGFPGLLLAQESNKLTESPRHQEWVDFKRDNGSVLKAFVVYPESSTSTKAVVLIHENMGLNEWARTFSDELAGQGFLVIAPDLISNTVEGIDKTSDFENSDKAREAIYALDQEQVNKDLDMVYTYINNDSSSNGKVSLVGFCWGGSQSFTYATQNPKLESVMVYYGTAPKDLSTLKSIKSPIYGFYGGADNRVNATIPDTEKAMKEYGNPYTLDIYEGAGHAFMRRGAEETYGPNTMAFEKSWEKLLSLLK
ncbi:dienelactone hydrolase family protein [Arenibacter sp. F26102]|uniref:dienelactone hydrolase family protein n=1 Tax=Arenibacter sp. F26102 TaxID=2926416 RepID=UPI001FF2F725|nr:dienelactone hydrolase family protein [Arenibacter sp. F26102]MCK0145619.1 dienelactone hydrolase family protein [Arenibacter sp. F26102]